MPSSLASRVFPVSQTRNCVPDAVVRHHVRGALARNLPELDDEAPAHDRTMVIAGSGPSLRDLPPFYADRAVPYDIFALGGSYGWLLDHGIIPHGWINADPMPIIADYVASPHRLVTHYLASMTHKFVFDQLADRKVVVWHSNVGAGTERVVAEARGGGLMVSGGPTGATRAPFLGHALGYRKFIFYGVDGSGGHVAPALRMRQSVRVEVDGDEYDVPSNFMHQASAMETILNGFPEWTIEIRGNGVMAALWRAARAGRADSREREAGDAAAIA